MADNTTPHPEEEKKVAPEVSDFQEKGENLQLAENSEVLKQFDTFEVQDMPESNELLERRRKIKNQLKELDVEPSKEEVGEPFGEEDEGGFWELLKEAGLGTRQLRFCCGGVLVLLVIGALTYGGSKLWTGLDFGSDEPERTDEEIPEVTDDDDDDSSSTHTTYPDPSLWTGMDLGDPDSKDDESTEAGEDLGLEGNGDDSLQTHVNDFAKIYEAAQVDVNEVMNKSNDRREALQDYQDELGFYYHLALSNYDKLEEENDVLTRAYSVVEENKNVQEGLFFDKLEELDAYASTGALDSFVGYSQELIRLRAHYLAREKLLSYYNQVIPYMETKIKAIELNEEALVKGIRVVEVEGSDLDLIETEADL